MVSKAHGLSVHRVLGYYRFLMPQLLDPDVGAPRVPDNYAFLTELRLYFPVNGEISTNRAPALAGGSFRPHGGIHHVVGLLATRQGLHRRICLSSPGSADRD